MRTAVLGRIFLPAILLVLTAAAPSAAGRTEELEKEVELLRTRVEELERGRGGGVDRKEAGRLLEKAEGPSATGRLKRPQTGETDDLRPRFGFNMSAFGSLDYSSRSREKAHNTFSLGELDIYSAANYGQHLNFLFEAAMEFENGSTEVDIERLWAGYSFSDFLVVRAGRFHTALGFWNRSFHHGKHLYVSVDRPFFLAFEHDNGVAPVHIVGLELSGNGRYFRYEFQAGNGPSVLNGQLVPNNVSDENGSKQFLFRLSFAPSALPGLGIGVFATRYELDTALKTGLYQDIHGVDLHYERSGLDIASEYFHFSNIDATADAFYIQLAYRFGRLTPYGRYESLDSDAGDPYLGALAGGADRSQLIGGIRYEIDELRSSLKVQYRYDDKKGGRVYNVFEAQWTFHF